MSNFSQQSTRANKPLRLVYSKEHQKWFVTSKTPDELDADFHEEVDNNELRKKLLHVLVDGTVTTLPYLDELVAMLSRNQLLEKNTERPLHTVTYASRNKDNTDVPNFKQRYRAFTTDLTPDELEEHFNKFVEQGQPGEMSRFYYSLNARDNQKTLKELAHALLDDTNVSMEALQAYVTKFAARTHNRAESKWFFDFDDDPNLVDDFVADVLEMSKANKALLPEEVVKHKTPNGYAVVVAHGFDTRELLSKWTNVELKRDDLLCVKWKRK